MILTEGWREERVSISGAWKHLCLTRLSDKDLFLSKLMKDDPQDREDALFIVRRNDWKVGTITEFFEEAVIPDLQEIHDEFDKARVALLREL